MHVGYDARRDSRGGRGADRARPLRAVAHLLPAGRQPAHRRRAGGRRALHAETVSRRGIGVARHGLTRGTEVPHYVSNPYTTCSAGLSSRDHLAHTTLKVLGVVTARGGSKGIPGKNLKPLAGKPLIAYTIESARESSVFDRLVLSTDDPAIADYARARGCEVPFMRPAELARDETPHLPMSCSTPSRWLREHEGYRPDAVMILQPTSPLRRPRTSATRSRLLAGDRRGFGRRASARRAGAREPDADAARRRRRERARCSSPASRFGARINRRQDCRRPG